MSRIEGPVAALSQRLWEHLATMLRIKALWRLHCCASPVTRFRLGRSRILPVFGWGGAGLPANCLLRYGIAVIYFLSSLEDSRDGHLGRVSRHRCILSFKAVLAVT